MTLEIAALQSRWILCGRSRRRLRVGWDSAEPAGVTATGLA